MALAMDTLNGLSFFRKGKLILSAKSCGTSLTLLCRGLEGMLNQRRKLLQYFRRKDFEGYSVLLVRLGLKDSFAKQVS